MLKISLILSLVFLAGHGIYARQGAGIGTNSPDASAALHVQEANNLGVLIPRTTPGQISSPPDGLIIYNTGSGNLSYSKNGAWTDIVPVPSGTIIMWAGSPTSLPAGWVLCNGQTYNLLGAVAAGGITTPDLRGYFIAGYSGAGDYATPGAPGKGSASHSLSASEMPSHTHSITSDHRHTISFSADDHTHDFQVEDAIKEDIGSIPGPSGATFAGNIYNLSTGAKTTDVVNTTVNPATATTGISLGSVGAGSAHENRPPYYVLAFIMKL